MDWWGGKQYWRAGNQGVENKTRPRPIQVNIRNMTRPKDQNKTKTKTTNRQSTSRAADQVVNVTTYEFGTKLN